MDEIEIKQLEALAPNNPELQELWDQHTVLKKQLDKLQSKAFFTPEDELEIKELKKQKLDAKTSLLQKIESLA